MTQININYECIIPTDKLITFLANKYPRKAFDIVADMVKYIEKLPSNGKQVFLIHRIKTKDGKQYPLYHLENARRTLDYLRRWERAWEIVYCSYLLTTVEMKDISLFLKKPKY